MLGLCMFVWVMMFAEIPVAVQLTLSVGPVGSVYTYCIVSLFARQFTGADCTGSPV